MRCDDVIEVLSHVAEGVEPADPGVRAHVESCLRCQAELVQYRKLLKALHLLRTEVLEPAPGLLTEILAGLEAAGERRAVRNLLNGRNAAYAGGTAAALAAGAVGVALLAHRRRLTLAS